MLPSVRHVSWAAPAVAVVVSVVVLVVNTIQDTDPALRDINIYERYWEDAHIAIGFWKTGLFPVSVNVPGADPVGLLGADRTVKRTTRAARPPAWRAGWTLPDDTLSAYTQTTLVRRFDDSGRPLLLGLAYRALGGVAPLLPFWLGALVAVPVLGWASLELAAQGRTWAAAIFPVLVGASPFVAETLALSYSAVGFSLAAALLLAAVAIACMGDFPPRPTALLLRALAAGLALAVCVLCRSGAMAVAPALAVAFFIGSMRAAAGMRWTRPRGLILAVGTLTLCFLPTAVARAAVRHKVAATFHFMGAGDPEPQQHALWWGVWTGLGDFDRTKGHRWRDAAAASAVAEAGGPRVTAGYYDPRAETILRDKVLRDIHEDPLWYAGILARRALATVSLRKLWPWPPLSGRSISPSASWNEGRMDAYYALVTPVDWVGVGNVRTELPVPLLLVPTWILLAWAGLRARAPEGAGLVRDAAVLATVGASALIVPVAISVASGIEPQVFAVTYWLGTALFIDRLASLLSARRRSTTRP